MAKRSVLDILASTGPIQANVELGEGCKTRLSIPGEYGAALTLDVAFLVQATLDGNQKVNAQGLLKISLPKAAVVADGKLTGKTASRAAFRPPETVAACLYASAGAEIPDDLLAAKAARQEPSPELTPADAAKAPGKPAARAKANGKAEPQPAA